MKLKNLGKPFPDCFQPTITYRTKALCTRIQIQKITKQYIGFRNFPSKKKETQVSISSQSNLELVLETHGNHSRIVLNYIEDTPKIIFIIYVAILLGSVNHIGIIMESAQDRLKPFGIKIFRFFIAPSSHGGRTLGTATAPNPTQLPPTSVHRHQHIKIESIAGYIRYTI